MLLSLNLLNQPLLASDFSSAVSSPLSTFTEWKRIRSFFWTRLWLKRTLWLLWFSILGSKMSPYQQIMLFGFLLSCVYWSSTFNFLKKFSFSFTTWLFGSRDLALAYLSFWHVFLTKLCLNWENCSSSFHLNTNRPCQAIAINWPNINNAVSQNGRPEEKERDKVSAWQ